VEVSPQVQPAAHRNATASPSTLFPSVMAVGPHRGMTARAQLLVTLLALLGVAIAFLCLQASSAYEQFGRELAAWDRFRGTSRAHLFDPSFRYLLAHPSPLPLWLRRPYVLAVAKGMAEFAVLAAAGVAIATSGERWLFWAPAVTWTLSPAVWGLPQNLGGSRAPFVLSGLPILFRQDWLAAPIGLMFLLLPGGVAAIVYGRRNRSVAGDRRWNLIGLASCLLIFVLWLSTRNSITGSTETGWEENLALLLPLFTFGVALTITRVWWLLLVVPVLSTIWWVSSVELLPIQIGVVATTVPTAVFVAGLGSGWKVIGAWLNQVALHARPSLVLVNALNVADAIMTHFFVHHGQAVESNPIVRVIGLPLKIVVVLAASLLLYRIRPRALVWPVIFLAAVLVWHISGLWLNAALLGSP